MPCSDDLYFPPEDNEKEAQYIPNASLELFKSAWGHCAGGPGKDPHFQDFLDAHIRYLLNSTSA